VSEAKELAQKDMAVKKVEIGGTYEGVVSGVMHFGLFVTVEIPVDAKAKTAKKAAKADATDATEAEATPEAATEEITATEEAPKADAQNVGYVEGLIHISEISWEKVNHPKDYHKIGDRLKVKVLGIDEKTGKLNLSIKQLQQDPWHKIAEAYPVGTTFTGKVTRIESFGVFVNVEPGVDGLIHASKLDPSRELKVGEEVIVNVESVMPDQRRMSLSMVLTEVPMGYK
jgi:ribosomal protein S1